MLYYATSLNTAAEEHAAHDTQCGWLNSKRDWLAVGLVAAARFAKIACGLPGGRFCFPGTLTIEA